MTRVLITGAGGFAGGHLVDACMALDWEVHGTCLPHEQPQRGGCTFHPADLREAAPVAALVATLQPDRIFHLAGQASVAAAWRDPAATLIDNMTPTLRVLDAVHAGAPQARVLVVGSSEEYGMVPVEAMPVAEEAPLRPVDPYGVSKVGADLLGLQHFLAFGSHVVRVRPFNHIGPGQRRGFVVADFAAQLAAIERGENPPVLRVGNLQSGRDFTDVRDVVQGYILALERGEAGAVYNVCSGAVVRIADLLDLLLAACTVPVRVEVDPARQRPADRPATVGSFAALRQATGWEPRIPLARTLADTLDFWRTAG